ncbi:MAG: YebC/PmpR family DNA-binding transcriptional regulator, partial [Nanoarchaeota archaeon]
TRHAKIITIVARDGGGDPEMNPALKTAIENAKAENMPNNNIERAIKKGTGEDKDAAQLMELSFEGYGPNGVAILVKTVTDNRNRTVASVRTAFNKHGGNMGENGSVSWMFHQKGRIVIAKPADDKKDEIELLLIDSGAEDIQEDGNNLEIICDSKDFSNVKKALEDKGIEIIEAKVELIPENTVEITDESAAKQVLRLVEALEDDVDVSSVSANFDIDEEILNKVFA